LHQPIKYCCCACIIGFSIHNIKFRVFFSSSVYSQSIFHHLHPPLSIIQCCQLSYNTKTLFFFEPNTKTPHFNFLCELNSNKWSWRIVVWILRVWFFFHINLDIHPSSLDMVEMDTSLCKLFFRFIYFGYDVNRVKKDRIKQCHIYLFSFYFLLMHFMFMYAYL